MDAATVLKVHADAIAKLRADIATEREQIKREFAAATIGGIKAGLTKQSADITARLDALAARLDEIERANAAGYDFTIIRGPDGLMTRVEARPA